MSANSPREEGTVQIYGTKKNLFFDLWSLSFLEKGERNLNPFGFAIDNLLSSTSIVLDTFAATFNAILGRIKRGSVNAIHEWIRCLVKNEPYLVSTEQILEVTRLFEIICNRTSIMKAQRDEIS